MPNNNLENIFQSSETQKSIPLSPGAWNRLDDLIENSRHKSNIFRFKIMGAAASIAILIGVVFIMNNNNTDDYYLELLVIDKSEILYSSSEVALLNSEHQRSSLQKLKPFYNENGEVKATVN
ncbi:MAG: hypothetical protein V3V00_03040 [Saprospiraceae bacterium]